MARVLAALIVAMLATLAAVAQVPNARNRAAPRHDPYLGYSPADPHVVAIDGAYVGRDPDPNIRAQLRRFPGSYVSGGF